MIRDSTQPPPRSKLVTALGVLLIAASVYKIFGLLNYDYYVFMFQHLPPKVILARHLGSMTLRLLGLAAGIGLVARKEWGRRLTLLLCFMAMAGAYWKHPQTVFTNIAIYHEYTQGINALPEGTQTEGVPYPLYPEGYDVLKHPLKNPSFPRISRMFYSLLDVVFGVVCLWVLTRRTVKQEFHVRS